MACYFSRSVMIITELPDSVLLRFGEVDVFVLEFVIASDSGQRIEAGRAVLQRQAHLMQLQLDLIDGLGSEVADVEQILLAARHQLRNGMDALALEAVVRPYRQVEILDRQCQISGKLLVDR